MQKEKELDSTADLNKPLAMPTYENGMTVEQFIAKLAADTDSDEDDKISLNNENLPGSCKSQYAMKFKLDTDQAIQNFIMTKKKEVSKGNTKGRFPAAFQTNAGAWLVDRKWKQTANPDAWRAE